MSSSSLSIQPTTRVAQWLAWTGDHQDRELRERLLQLLQGAVLPLIIGATNSILIALVGYFHLELRALVVLAALDALLLGLRIYFIRQKARPLDAMFVTGLLWTILQCVTIFIIVRTGDLPMTVIIVASSLGIVGGIVGRNFAVPRYAMIQVIIIEASVKLSIALEYSDFWAVLLAQSIMFIVASFAIVRQQRIMAQRAIRAEIVSRNQAITDPLTGLLNRRGLERVIEENAFHKCHHFVFYLDLDGFKGVNDRSGHLAGDLLLQKVAERLLLSAGSDAAICRLGGDEFIVLKGFQDADELHHFAMQIVGNLSNPYDIDGFGRHTIGVSIGIAETTVYDGQGLKRCISNADKALYLAKAQGKGTYRVAHENEASMVSSHPADIERRRG